MQYQSTRDKNLKASSAQAILNGLAPDGGLYTMPSFDEVKFDYTTVLNMDTMSMSTKILSKLLPDFSEAEMAKLVHDGYTGKFETDHLTPTVPVGEDFILELFRGPTSAFKDVALSMLPRLMTASKEKLGVDDEIMILTATSGDTGKAAMEGFCDVVGTKIIVFYPDGGVSAVQKAQMVTQGGDNTCVAAVRGNFDDAQTAVKQVFAKVGGEDLLAGKGVRLSSANSINIGRLAPQVVYYFRAYADLVRRGTVAVGERVDYVVPTGNFGDILAAYYAKRMGLPVGKLICASNSNNVLTDFLRTGIYDRNRPFHTTVSPSMDILISSNLERLLFYFTGENDEEVRGYMEALGKTGRYEVSDAVKTKLAEEFWGGFCGEEETEATVGAYEREYGYLIDTHTAVAAQVMEQYRRASSDKTLTVFVSTASPYKFCGPVLTAIGKTPVGSGLELLDQLHEATGVPVPQRLAALRGKPRRFDKTVEKQAMETAVLDFLK